MYNSAQKYVTTVSQDEIVSLDTRPLSRWESFPFSRENSAVLDPDLELSGGGNGGGGGGVGNFYVSYCLFDKVGIPNSRT